MSINLSFGAELEFGDICQQKGLPKGCNWDRSDPTMVNSNGIAVDPKCRAYSFGGEVQTRPTKSLEEQVDVFQEILEWFEHKAVVNHRSNLHVHVGIPGLHSKLPLLKQFQEVIHKDFREIIDELEPIPKPTKKEYPYDKSLAGAVWRFKRRKRSHHMFLPEKRVAWQMKALTTKEFFNREPPQSKDGKPLFHAQPRVCVNLRQQLQTNTIEFRHFPGTINPIEFKTCLLWCKAFVSRILKNKSIKHLWEQWKDCNLSFPSFAPYQHDLEFTYKQTCWDGSVDKKKIADNIKRILEQRPKILVVCLGNINRSPAIEAILRKKGYPVQSAGFTPRGNKAAEKTIKYMSKLGYDLSKHHPKPITKKACSWADIILVTTSKHKAKINKILTTSNREKVQAVHKDIPDPGPLNAISTEYNKAMEKLLFETQLWLDMLVDPGGVILSSNKYKSLW